jgi:ATP-dependent protease HslVU (ClpYQ) peptidase subunit
MTTLVGLSSKNFTVLAADSQITEDNLRTISSLTPKIVDVNGYLLGITGDSRPGDILTYNWNPPTYQGEDPVQFMGKKIIPSIIRAFEQHGYDWAKQAADEGFDYLISFDANLFHIACDMSFISNQESKYGIGSGGQIALGYLYSLAPSATKTLAASQAVARKAIEIASVLDVNTSPPVQLVVQERTFE